MFGSKHFKSREEKLKFYEEWKLSFIPETLKSEIPSEFIAFLNYTKAMSILDSPEYDAWRKTFKQLLVRIGTSLNDFSYEWVISIFFQELFKIITFWFLIIFEKIYDLLPEFQIPKIKAEMALQ